LSSQFGQPLVSGSTQQTVQPTIQTSALGVAHQSGPSSPQTTAATTATSVQSTPPTSGVSVALVSTIPASIPQASLP